MGDPESQAEVEPEEEFVGDEVSNDPQPEPEPEASDKPSGEEEKPAEEAAKEEPEVPEEKPEEKAKLEDSIPDLDPEVYDDAVVAANKAAKDAIRQLREQNEKLVEGMAARETDEKAKLAAQLEVEFDEAVAAQGEYKDVLGEGKGSDVTGEKKDNRDKLALRVSSIAQEYSIRGKPIPRLSALVKESLPGLFPEQTSETTRREIQDKLSARDKQVLMRATDRKSRELSPDQRAAKYAEAQYAKMGLGPGGEEEEEF